MQFCVLGVLEQNIVVVLVVAYHPDCTSIIYGITGRHKNARKRFFYTFFFFTFLSNISNAILMYNPHSQDTGYNHVPGMFRWRLVVSVLVTRKISSGCIGHPDQNFQRSSSKFSSGADLSSSESPHHLQFGEKYRVASSYVERLVYHREETITVVRSCSHHGSVEIYAQKR